MQERRAEPRWPSYLGGQAAFADCYPPTDCIVRNTSMLGARIELNTAGPLPPVFLLRIPARKVEVRVEIRWCGTHTIGVKTVTERTPDVADTELSGQLRRLTAQNSALKGWLAELKKYPT